MSVKVDKSGEKVGLTYKEMCEFISWSGMFKREGKPLTAEEIFNYSPTGELFMITEWHAQAVEFLRPAFEKQQREEGSDV